MVDEETYDPYIFGIYASDAESIEDEMYELYKFVVVIFDDEMYGLYKLVIYASDAEIIEDEIYALYTLFMYPFDADTFDAVTLEDIIKLRGNVYVLLANVDPLI